MFDDVVTMMSDDFTFGDVVAREGLGESGGECRGDLLGGGLSGSEREGDEMLR